MNIKHLVCSTFFVCSTIHLALQFSSEIPNFCYDSNLEGFRLNTEVIKKKLVPEMIDCILECVIDPCCRSINYRKGLVTELEPNCELLHNVAHNTSQLLLERNNSYGYVYFSSPEKEYNASCLSRGMSNLHIRLANSKNRSAGRVEIYHPGYGWGTICDDIWRTTEGDVVCRQLGFTGAREVFEDAHFGEGTGPILLDEIDCKGDESFIWECSHDPWNEHDCDHFEDAGVECY